jgi:glycosyltransferase involved in cell wall biosynthesis
MVTSITLDNKLGGIASSLVSYSKALHINGIEHHIILPKDAPIIKELVHLPNVTLFCISKTVLKCHLLSGFIFLKSIRSNLLRSKLTLVHNAKIFSSIAKVAKRPALINHSGKTNGTNHSYINIFITQAGKRRHFLTYPNSTATSYVINHGFETHPLNLTGTKEDHSNILTIISAGRLVLKKGFIDLIKAAKILEDKNVALEIKIFGDGELKDSLTSAINDLQLKNVKLMGWTDNLHREFSRGNIFCIPSHIEPFGLIIGEAMLAGLPVISTKTDGALEIFGNENTEQRGGILVEISAPEAIAEAIMSLMDKEKRAAIANSAFEHINQNFNLDRLADDLKKVIDG